MTNNHDSLREAFSVLASNSAAGATPNPSLENRMMTEAARGKKRSGRRMTLAVAVCMLLGVSGATVVAAGGVGAVLDWFATAEVIHPDGTRTQLEVTPEGEIKLDETHSVQVPADRLDDLKGRKIRIMKAPTNAKSSGAKFQPTGLPADRARYANEPSE